MNIFISFIKKEFLYILRDRRTLTLLLALPIIQLIIFGYAITTELNQIPFAVYDQSKNTTSSQLIEHFANNKYFNLTEEVKHQHIMEDAFRRGDIKLALIIPSDFESEIHRPGSANIQILVDASLPNEAEMIMQYAKQVINQYQSDIQSNNLNHQKVSITTKMLYNPQMKSAYNFVPGIIGLVLMLVCTMMTSLSIVREKEEGTITTLIVSPMNPIYMILAKMTPYLVIGLFDIIIILIISNTLLDVPIVGSIFTILFLSSLFLLSALSLGLLISSLVNNQQEAVMINQAGLMIPTLVLSGLIYQINNMPLILQYIANILPAKWFISAMRNVIIKGVGVEGIIVEGSILILITFILSIISFKRLKKIYRS